MPPFAGRPLLAKLSWPRLPPCRAVYAKLPAHNHDVKVYHDRSRVIFADSWAGCERIHQYYLAETERRKREGKPTY